MSWQDKIRNPNCTLCPLHESAEHVCLMDTGKKSAKLIIVGEAPGAREDDQHAAFVGPAGQLLDELLHKVGISREDCYITNAAKCRPPDNRAPTRAEVKACVPYLAEEIYRVKSKWILCLGNTALQAVTGRSGITKHRGKVYSVGDERMAIATFHPAAALRSSHYRPQIEADLVEISRRMEGRDDRPKTRTRLIRTKSELKLLIAKLEGADTIAFDLETSGLHEWAKDARIVTVGVSWAPGEAAVVAINHSSLKKSNDYMLKLLKPVLEDPKKKYIAHNGKFDCKWLSAFGVHVPLSFDTMIAAHLLDENRPKGLKVLSQMLLGADDYDIDVKDCFNHSLHKLAIYNGKDCDYTFRLYEIFKKQLKAQPRVARLFMKLMMPASDVFTRLELGGTYVDMQRLQKRTDEAAANVAMLQKFMLQFTKQKTLNFNSPAQVGVWLFNELKLEVVETTKTGAPSTKESVLLKLAGEHKAVEALLKYRKWAKFLSTYLLPWSERVDSRSRIHPSYRLTGTVTGRLSSSEPNLQQVPRDTFIRGILGSQPGWSFVEADYSQIELRLAAMLANEPTMKEILKSGHDMHNHTAESILGKHKISKDERVIWGKHPNFGLLFSMMPEKYQEYCANNGIYITSSQAEEVYAVFHETYPRLKVWHDRMRRVVRAQGYVQTAMGRIRHLPDIRSEHMSVRMEAERQAINSVVQGLASDICLFAGVRISRKMDPQHGRLVGSVHDALLFEVREEVVEDIYAPVIKNEMEDMRPVYTTFGAIIDVPIVVDVEIGTHWSEGTELKRV